MGDDKRRSSGGRHFAPSGSAPSSVPSAASRPGSRFAGSHRAPGRAKRTVRRRGRAWKIALGAAVALLVAAAGVGGWWLYRSYQERQALNQDLAAVVDLISESDEVVIPLDEAVASEIDDAENTELATLMESYDDTVAQLDQAEEQLQAVRSTYSLNDEDAALCDNIQTSISARRDMLSVGQELLAADTALSTARSHLETALGKMVEANDAVLRSVEAANEYSKSLAGEESSQDDPNVPVDLDNQALTLLNEAKQEVASAKEAFPDADYTSYETYLDAKIAAVELLLDIDEAIAAKRYSAASGKVDDYNAADAAATEAAAAVPETASDLLREPYEQITSTQRDRYNAARRSAADADTAIRESMGTDMGVGAAGDGAGSGDGSPVITE